MQVAAVKDPNSTSPEAEGPVESDGVLELQEIQGKRGKRISYWQGIKVLIDGGKERSSVHHMGNPSSLDLCQLNLGVGLLLL